MLFVKGEFLANTKFEQILQCDNDET